MREALAAVMLAAVMACGGTDSGGGAGSAGIGGTGGLAGSGGAGGTGGPAGCTPFNLDTAATDTCSGDDVCLGGACVPAFPRHYRMTVFGKASAQKQDGSDWDPAGGLPDPYIGVFIDARNVFPDGTDLFQTTPLTDALTVPRTSTTVDLESADLGIKTEMRDEDGTLDDIIVACDELNLTPALIRFGISCAWLDGSSSFQVGFEAQ